MTTVVIGHGRTPGGKGWGPKIDECLVVRLWDNHWQDPTDYGTRYDYGYMELSPKQFSRLKFYNQRTPDIGWIGGLLKRSNYDLPPKTQVILTGEWTERGRRLGGVGETGKLKLTRGVQAACWAISQRPDAVVLVGFDNVYTGEALTPEAGFPDAYRILPSTSWKNYKGGGTKYHNHDYIVEGKILQTLADDSGVILHHAQDIW